jgi:hypothetical protein
LTSNNTFSYKLNTDLKSAQKCWIKLGIFQFNLMTFIFSHFFQLWSRTKIAENGSKKCTFQKKWFFLENDIFAIIRVFRPEGTIC